MNYIEYMSGGGATDSTAVIQLPPYMEAKEMKHIVTKEPEYPSYLIYPNISKLFKYGFRQGKTSDVKGNTVGTNNSKSDNNAAISSNNTSDRILKIVGIGASGLIPGGLLALTSKQSP